MYLRALKDLISGLGGAVTSDPHFSCDPTPVLPLVLTA